MLKNKIYKYLSSEIFKNFIIILLTFTAIAWVVRAVNFLDLMVQDGYSSSIYLKYSMLNISTIITRFIPLSFLLSLTISIIKFERQQELLILWTSGLNKIRVTNIFILIAVFVTVIQLILSLVVNPFLLNQSRSLLSDTKALQINAVLKSNDFSDTFEDITFYIEKKNDNNELINIFIKDLSGNLSALVQENTEKKNSTIIAKRGFVVNNKLILYNGMIQTINKKKKYKNIQFEKTELSLKNISGRAVRLPKIQETSSKILMQCIFNFNNLIIRNCSKNFKVEAIQTMTGRLGSPLYTPLTSIIISFLLIYQKEKKLNFLKKYILFILSFIILILTRIFLKYTGFNYLAATSYFIFPVIIFFLFYIFLSKKTGTGKI